MVEITLDARPGQIVTLRHGEVLNREGNLYTKNLRAARAADTFICKGGPTVLRPRFTYHGFRYVSVEGMGDTPELGQVYEDILRRLNGADG